MASSKGRHFHLSGTNSSNARRRMDSVYPDEPFSVTVRNPMKMCTFCETHTRKALLCVAAGVLLWAGTAGQMAIDAKLANDQATQSHFAAMDDEEKVQVMAATLNETYGPTIRERKHVSRKTY